MTDMNRIYDKIEYLPPFPQAMSRVMKLMNDGSASTDAVAEELKFDQALTTNVLKFCNSSYFGLRRTVSNLGEAVVYIGLDELKKIILRSGTRQYFQGQRPGYEGYSGELWRHVLAVSTLADKINELVVGADRDLLSIAALLHDVGKLVLSEFVVDASEEIFKLIDEESLSFLEAEKKVLGVDHGEIGAQILERWSFPQEVVSAVGKHHKEAGPDDSSLDNIVRLADNVSLLMGYGTSVDGLAYPGFGDVCRQNDLDHEVLEHIMAGAVEEIESIENDYGLSGEDQT